MSLLFKRRNRSGLRFEPSYDSRRVTMLIFRRRAPVSRGLAPALLLALAVAPQIAPAATRTARLPADGAMVSNSHGVQLRIRAVAFTPDGVEVAAKITNGSPATLMLMTSGGHLVLRDDRGTLLRLKPPADNPQLKVAPNGVIEGTLMFVGSPARDATRLVLDTNDKSANAADRIRPSLELEIPLQ